VLKRGAFSELLVVVVVVVVTGTGAVNGFDNDEMMFAFLLLSCM
jgi:hypothetical protein